MKRRVAATIFWLLSACVMIFIFLMSAKVASESQKISGGTLRVILGFFYNGFDGMSVSAQEEVIESYQFIIRKTAHFSIYALLGVFTCCAVSCHTANTTIRFCLPMAISSFYAATDELHQYFVPGRSCELRDITIDSLGALCGIIFVFLIFAILQRRKRKK